MRTNVLAFVLCAFSANALASQNMQLEMTCEQTYDVRQAQRLEQIQTQAQVQRQVQIQAQRKLRMETLLRLLPKFNSYLDNGTLIRRSYKLPGGTVTISYFTYDRSAKSDKDLSLLLDLSRSAFFVPTGPIIVVDSGRIPNEFIPHVAVHEFGEFIFADHAKATTLEFFHAKNTENMTKYVRWLERHHHDRFEATTRFQDLSLAEWFSDDEFLSKPAVRQFIDDLNEGRILPVDFIASPTQASAAASYLAYSYFGLGKNDELDGWFAFWPQALLMAQARMTFRTQRVNEMLGLFQKDAMHIIAQHEYPVAGFVLIAKIDYALSKRIKLLAEEDKQLVVSSTTQIVLNHVKSRIIQAILAKIKRISKEADDPNFVAWKKRHFDALLSSHLQRNIRDILQNP